MIIKEISNLLVNMKSFKIDPFNNQRKLDMSEEYHLRYLVFQNSLYLFNRISSDEYISCKLKFKEYHLATELLKIDSEEESDEKSFEQELMNTFFDCRFDLWRKTGI